VGTYPVTITSNPVLGGSVDGAKTYNHGETVTLTATPNTGYTFDGWFQGNTRVSSNVTHTFSITSAVTLEARFTIERHPVTLTRNLTAGGTVTGGGTFNHGQSVTVSATVNSAYTFGGWYNGDIQVSPLTSYTFNVVGNITLEARFIARHNITATSSPTVGGTASGGGMFSNGENVTVIATANTGYTFDGWFSGNTRISTQANYSFTADKNETLQARFTLIQYAINVTAGTGGTTTGGGTHNHGANVSLRATANTGYSFDGWYSGNTQVSSQANYNFIAAKDETLQARFTIIRYTYRVTAGVGGTATGNGTHNHGVSVTLRATPNKGYSFVGWYQGNSFADSQSSISVTAMSDLTVEARFVRLGSISGDGSVTIGDALEILKYLAKLPSAVSPTNPVAWSAARITAPEGTPTIGDALEILKYLAKLPSMVV
jgi:uncharacterized repeat protein (TIGR02543 family)